ncbi:unnamed protein product [Sphagnum tenellum]
MNIWRLQGFAGKGLRLLIVILGQHWKVVIHNLLLDYFWSNFSLAPEPGESFTLVHEFLQHLYYKGDIERVVELLLDRDHDSCYGHDVVGPLTARIA